MTATITEVFAGIAVADYSAALAWYERLVGRPADVHPNETEAMWQMRPGSWIYIASDGSRAGSSFVTILVDDLEAFVAELAGREIDTGEIDTIPDAVKRVRITDPEGNKIQFGQPLG